MPRRLNRRPLRGRPFSGFRAALCADVYAHARTSTDAALDGIDHARLGTAMDVIATVGQRATALLDGARAA